MKSLLIFLLALSTVFLRGQTSPTVRFDSIADMVAYTIPGVNNKLSAIVSGGTATGNSFLAGEFAYSASSTVTTNTYAVFKPLSATGRWIRITGATYNQTPNITIPASEDSYAFQLYRGVGTNALSIGATATNAIIQSFTSLPLFINPVGANNTILNELGGFVGVGTPTPTGGLEVFSNSGTGGSIRLSKDSATLRGAVNFGRNNSGSYQAAASISAASTAGGNTNGQMNFNVSDSTGTLQTAAMAFSSGFGFGISPPTARVTIGAGTSTAGTAPLKLTAGTNLTAPEPGAVEYDGTSLFYTDGTSTRKTISTGTPASIGDWTFGTGTQTGPGAGSILTVGALTLGTSAGNANVIIDPNGTGKLQYNIATGPAGPFKIVSNETGGAGTNSITWYPDDGSTPYGAGVSLYGYAHASKPGQLWLGYGGTGKITLGNGSDAVTGTARAEIDGTSFRSLINFKGSGTANGFNITTPVTELTVGSTSTSSPRGIMSAQYTTDALGARIHMRKARGTEASPTIVVTGDDLGGLQWAGYDGAAYQEMASIRGAVTGTVAASRVPTQLIFNTATDASPSVLTDVMWLLPNGNLGLGTSSVLPVSAQSSTAPIFKVLGMNNCVLSTGYSGAGSTVSSFISNSENGTATGVESSNTGNIGIQVQALGSGTGDFAGVTIKSAGTGSTAGINAGLVSRVTSSGAGNNIGVVSSAVLAGSTVNAIGGYFAVNSGSITRANLLSTTIGGVGAALVADVQSGGAANIFEARNATALRFVVTTGGFVGIGGVANTNPGFKASSTTLAIRLGDDSADAPITASGGTFSGNIIASGATSVIRLKNYTVATLPAGTQGDTAFVTDALAPTFLATVVGGGAVVTPVFYNGSNWVGY